jgi:hypothetical protein
MSGYVMRQGRRIAVETLDTGIIPNTKRKPFKAQWVKLPLHWSEALRRSKSVSTYQLAHVILFETFKRKHVGGDVVLSWAVTGMPHSTRARAANELVELGLIKIIRNGKHALRVTPIQIPNPNPKPIIIYMKKK